MLTVSNLEVVYNDVVLVLRGISMEVPEGGAVALLGANGAGKTTLLRALSGVLDHHDAEITKGTIRLGELDIGRASPPAIVRHGVTQVPEGRRVFAEFTVEENLRAGAHRSPARQRENLARVYDLFGPLAERRSQLAGYLSGGEQQMLAIGRALMAEPRYLLLDEPSLGLAPMMVERISKLISEIHRQGVAILLVEQNAEMALSICEHGYVMETGAIVMDRPTAELRQDADVQEFYLGMSSGDGDGPRSFRDVKHYRRRKRWLS